jgi:hypothetical protein
LGRVDAQLFPFFDTNFAILQLPSAVTEEGRRTAARQA